MKFTREQSIRATFDVFKPNGVIEVRAISGKTFSGYYKDRNKLIDALRENDDKTWYFVMNDIDDACYSREQCEHVTMLSKTSKTTSDKEITALKWILIDADPVRPSGVSSTQEEKNKSKETIGKVYNYLRTMGFSEPVVCDSGNGYHLLYHVDLAVEDSAEIKKFLQALDMLFTDAHVAIDTSVFNPARITKVYGTIARKGANTKERPHRSSRILRIPQEIKRTSLSLIRKVSEILPEPEKPSYYNGYRESFDIDNFIHTHNLPVHSDTTAGGIRKIVLDRCPFDENHKYPDAALFVMGSGAIGFHCFHNSCRDRSWKDVRKLYEPNAYERREIQNNKYEPPPKPKKGEPAHFLKLEDIHAVDRSQIVSIKTGITELDKKLGGMNKGEMSIWSGGNGSGKSTLLSQIALETIERGYNVALFSGELTQGRVKEWLTLQAAGRQNTRLSNNGFSYYAPKEVKERIDKWAADKLWVYNNDYGHKVGDVVADFKAHIEKYKTDAIIIDNLMALDLSEYRGEKYDRQTLLALELSDMSKKYNVHIHFVCHPRKPNGFLRKADISGTADLTNAADNVFMMHRVNQDFMRLAGDFIGKAEVDRFKVYTNVIEVMKNRDLGKEDEYIGLVYEPESKRLLNEAHENKVYGWEEGYSNMAFINAITEELPM